jgi:hypothetical protein
VTWLFLAEVALALALSYLAARVGGLGWALAAGALVGAVGEVLRGLLIIAGPDGIGRGNAASIVFTVVGALVLGGLYGGFVGGLMGLLGTGRWRRRASGQRRFGRGSAARAAAGAEVAALISDLGDLLPEVRRGWALDYLETVEPGLAMEVVCDSLAESRRVLDPGTAARVVALARRLKVDEGYWLRSQAGGEA